MAAALLAAFLLAVPPSLTLTAGIHAGDLAAFEYVQSLITPLPNGTTSVQSYESRFTVLVVSINDTRPPGVISYVIAYSESMNTTTSRTGGVNFTDFFDPYDNQTYLGAIGFYPFVHPDLQPGSRENLPVTVAITQGPNGTVRETSTVNVTVGRTPTYAVVNYTARAGSALPPSTTLLKYNATDGVLAYGVTKVPLGEGGIERDFTFRLESFTPARSPGFPLIGYAIGGSFAALAAVFVADRLRGRLRHGRTRKGGRGR